MSGFGKLGHICIHRIIKLIMLDLNLSYFNGTQILAISVSDLKTAKFNTRYYTTIIILVSCTKGLH